MSERVFLEIGIGNRAEYATASKTYDDLQIWLSENGPKYSLPSSFDDLDEVQHETLASIYVEALPSEKPKSLIVGRLILELDPSAGVERTRNNFLSLCKGDKGACKNAPNKKLHYLGTPMHRIVKDFIAQGGDITRGDGSGGESIYGGRFNDEKAGLKVKPARGSVAMANSGKNSNTSQFFLVLTSDSAQLKKIAGKYVVFGRVIEGSHVLDRINDVGTDNGTPMTEVWIDSCGTI